MHTKKNSAIESLRKPVSKFLACCVGVFALFTIPRSFSSDYGELSEITGFTLLIVAALGRVWCSLYIAGRKDRALCTEGPYSLCRNPLYFFSFIGVIGFTLGLQSVFALLFCGTAYGIYYYFVIKSEERRLTELFGADYRNYTQTTPRFFPAFRPIRRLDHYVINLKIVERSLTEVVWFLLAIIIIEGLEAVHANGYLIAARLPF